MPNCRVRFLTGLLFLFAAFILVCGNQFDFTIPCFNSRTRVGCDRSVWRSALIRRRFNSRTRVGCERRRCLPGVRSIGFNSRTRVGCEVEMITCSYYCIKEEDSANLGILEKGIVPLFNFVISIYREPIYWNLREPSGVFPIA